MATSEPGRAVRFVNVPFGAWAVAAPWILGRPTDATWNSVVGVLLVLVSVLRGTIWDEYGEWRRQYIAWRASNRVYVLRLLGLLKFLLGHSQNNPE